MNDLMTKSFMSYVDLKKAALKDDLEAGDAAAPPMSDLEMASLAATDEKLRHFFEEAGLVREEMDGIRAILARIESANEQSRSLTRPEALGALRDATNADIVQVLRQAREIKARLEDMDASNAQQRRLSGCREGTLVDRTRTAVTNGLRKKLRGLMMDFQALRQRIMAEHRETVQRRFFTITGEVPQEEVLEKIVSEGRSEELLQAAIAEHGRGPVMEAVVEIQDRHEAAREVEKSLLELHQVFLDMAVVVEMQGEHLDDIERHVASASDYVTDANKELGKAKQLQRGSRKWMCIGIVVLLLLILVVIIPIATSFKKS